MPVILQKRTSNLPCLPTVSKCSKKFLEFTVYGTYTFYNVYCCIIL